MLLNTLPTVFMKNYYYIGAMLFYSGTYVELGCRSKSQIVHSVYNFRNTV